MSLASAAGCTRRRYSSDGCMKYLKAALTGAGVTLLAFIVLATISVVEPEGIGYLVAYSLRSWLAVVWIVLFAGAFLWQIRKQPKIE